MEVDYDPAILSYEDLLAVFWNSHSPTYPSRRRQYASILFYHGEEEQQAAQTSLERESARRNAPVHTELMERGRFWVAEDYHQKFYLRQMDELARHFARIYPDPAELMNSTAAARVNGYAGGHGTPESLSRDLDGLALPPSLAARLMDLVGREALGVP